MKRKTNPTEISLSLPPEKEAKIEISDEKIDPAISQQWLEAAQLAFETKELKPLLALLNSTDINLAVIDWNKAPQEGPLRGVTLAYLATELAHLEDETPPNLSSSSSVANQYRLLQALLNSPRKNLQFLDWNSHPPLDNKEMDTGITLAWKAVYLSHYCSKQFLLNLLEDSLPLTEIQKLNWNAHPCRGVDRTATLAWLVFDMYHEYEESDGNQPGKLINFIHNAPKDFLDKLDWNACHQNRSIIWITAVKAYLGKPKLLDLFFDSSVTIQNWNSTTKESGEGELMWGASLAYMAIQIKITMNDSRLYEKLIKSFQQRNSHINWNACRGETDLTENERENIHDYGVSVVWKAVELFYEKHSSELLKILLAEPVEVLKTIDWNEPAFSPDVFYKSNDVYFMDLAPHFEESTSEIRSTLTETLIHDQKLEQSSAAIFFRCSKGWFFKRVEEGKPSKEHRVVIKQNSLENLSDILHSLNGHLYKKLNSSETSELIKNMRVDLFTFLVLQIPKRLNVEHFKNLLHPEILATLDWTYLLGTPYGTKLAWKAFELLYAGGDARLLENLLTQPPVVLQEIDWSSPHDHPHSLCSWDDKREFYLMKDDSKEMGMRKSNLENLIQIENLSNKKISVFNRSSLEMCLVSIDYGIIKYAEIIVLKTDASSKLVSLFSRLDSDKPYFIMSREERDLLTYNIDCHLFSEIIALAPQKLNPKFVQNLLHYNILSFLTSKIWTTVSLLMKFASLINGALLPVEEALSQLPIRWLKNLLTELSLFLNSASIHYLNLLISIKSTGEFDSSLAAFIAAYPSKLLIAYRSILPSQPFYAKAQFELANSCLAEINDSHEQKRQDILSKAFYHACQWYHYSPEEKPGENQNFIFRLVTQMFSKPEGILEKPPLAWPEKTKKFLDKIAHCHPEILDSSITLFMKSIQNGKLEIEVMNLKSKLVEPSTSTIRLGM